VSDQPPFPPHPPLVADRATDRVGVAGLVWREAGRGAYVGDARQVRGESWRPVLHVAHHVADAIFPLACLLFLCLSFAAIPERFPPPCCYPSRPGAGEGQCPARQATRARTAGASVYSAFLSTTPYIVVSPSGLDREGGHDT
jgi:hypothetical protein